MQRHFFTSDDLNDLERFEVELEDKGIHKEQIHVLSLDETAVGRHRNLHEVAALMKKDMVRAGWWGLLAGGIGALLVVGIAYALGGTQTQAGWLPVVFLALIVLGFLIWEAGLWGIQKPNAHFERFERELAAGRHVFFVDLDSRQEPILNQAVRSHPAIALAGTGTASPHWLVNSTHWLKRFLGETMP